jgi:hypothetical protein
MQKDVEFDDELAWSKCLDMVSLVPVIPEKFKRVFNLRIVSLKFSSGLKAPGSFQTNPAALIICLRRWAAAADLGGRPGARCSIARWAGLESHRATRRYNADGHMRVHLSEPDLAGASGMLWGPGLPFGIFRPACECFVWVSGLCGGGVLHPPQMIKNAAMVMKRPRHLYNILVDGEKP